MNTAPFRPPSAAEPARPRRARAVAFGTAEDQAGSLPALLASLAICVLLIAVGATILVSMVTGHG
jgi:hypothetical protein